jgi:hypothetical protein
MPADYGTPHPTQRLSADAGGDDRRESLDSAADLAPDLVELALQLGDDAAFLAARYPASRYSAAHYNSTQFPAAQVTALPTSDARFRRWTRRLPPVAAGILLAIGIGLLAANHVADAPFGTEILKNQPGIRKNQQDDQVEMAVGRRNQTSSMAIPLEEDGQSAAPRRPVNVLVGPQLQVRADEGVQTEVRNSQGVEEVGFGTAPAAGRMARDELSMLRTQLMAFEKVIKRLQLELERRDELQARTEAQLQELTDEVVTLRGRISEEPVESPEEP